jgi:hypothetical protein
MHENSYMLQTFDKNENAKKLGKMKDEMKGHRIVEFIALTAKMYSILSDVGKKFDMTKKKGVPKSVSIRHQNYRDVLNSGRKQTVNFHRFQNTKSLEMQTIEQKKTSLSAIDDKSYYFTALHSIRYGHYRIPFIQQQLSNVEQNGSSVSQEQPQHSHQNDRSNEDVNPHRDKGKEKVLEEEEEQLEPNSFFEDDFQIALELGIIT